MDKVREILKVDITQEQGFQYLKSKQYDDLSREYQIFFTNRGIPIALDGNEVIEVNLWKRGDSSPYSRRFCTFENKVPIWVLTFGSLKYDGEIDVEFVIFNADGSRISTRTIHINVQKSLIGYQGIIASEDFDILHALIKEAVTIPSLIETFKLSQAEINQLIKKINSDIATYQNTFQNLSTQAQELIANVSSFLETVKRAESERISNEEARISAESLRKKAETLREEKDAIYKANDEARELAEQNRETKTNEAIVRADNATENTKTTIGIAENEIDKMKAIINNYEISMIDMDGGYPASTEDSYLDDYDGGTP